MIKNVKLLEEESQQNISLDTLHMSWSTLNAQLGILNKDIKNIPSIIS